MAKSARGKDKRRAKRIRGGRAAYARPHSGPRSQTGQALSETLSLIKPSKEESEAELAFARFMVDYISTNAPEGTQTVLVGSMAKRTFLRDKRDIDIFVLFDQSFPRAGLEDAIRRIMEKAFPAVGYQVSYAEHPYVRFHFEGRRIDLVPAYQIRSASERVSAVDRSVLHTVFVVDSLLPEQYGDVLLLKQFLRSAGIYGAEIKTEGFSGYLCELLIIRYKSFMNLLRQASDWGDGVFIDLEGTYRRSEMPEAKKRFGPFVVIDPTDRDRNVAAAVSKNSLKMFIRDAKAFLKRPSRTFFFREQPSFEERLDNWSRSKIAFMLSMPRPGIVDDVLWGQLKKMVNQLKAYLSDFSPSEIIADDSRHLVRLGIVLGRDRLSELMLKKGPPLKMKDHAAHFIASHKRARFIRKSGHLWAQVKRPIIDAEDMILGFFREYSRTKSHLAYPEEMLVLERSGASRQKKAGVRNTGSIKNGGRNVSSMVTKKKSKPKGKKVVKGKGKKKR